MAATDAQDASPTALKCPVFLNCSNEIVAAGGPESALSAENRAQKDLVQTHDSDEHVGGNLAHSKRSHGQLPMKKRGQEVAGFFHSLAMTPAQRDAPALAGLSLSVPDGNL